MKNFSRLSGSAWKIWLSFHFSCHFFDLVRLIIRLHCFHTHRFVFQVLFSISEDSFSDSFYAGIHYNRFFADINYGLRIFKQVACSDTDNSFVSAYNAKIDQFLESCNRGCTRRFDSYAFKPCKVFLGCKDFFISNGFGGPPDSRIAVRAFFALTGFPILIAVATVSGFSSGIISGAPFFMAFTIGQEPSA